MTDLSDKLEAAKSYQSKLSEVFEPLITELFNQKLDEFISDKLAREVDLLIDDSDTVSTAVNDIDDLRNQIDGFRDRRGPDRRNGPRYDPRRRYKR